jgi:ABC-type glutathione transport system ATPase component
MSPLLDVRNLRVAFGQRAVVHGIDLCVEASQRVALVGESGSGKTVSALRNAVVVELREVIEQFPVTGGR